MLYYFFAAVVLCWPMMLLHTRLPLNGSSNVVFNIYNVYTAENVDQSCVAFRRRRKNILSIAYNHITNLSPEYHLLNCI